MGDPATLAQFIQYGLETRTDGSLCGLILWDHGGGPMVGCGYDEIYDDPLTLGELSSALEDAGVGSGRRLDFIGFDACLMGSLEVGWVLRDYADYLIASEETEPGSGWNYAFLRDIDSCMTGADIGREVIDSYFTYYENMDENRLESKADLTLSCADLSQIDQVSDALDTLFRQADADLYFGQFVPMSRVRLNTKSFGKFTTTVEYDLIDARHLAENMPDEYSAVAQSFIDALDNYICYGRANIEYAGGASLYYPYENTSEVNRWISSYKDLGFSASYYSYISDFKSLNSDNSGHIKGVDSPLRITRQRTPDGGWHFSAKIPVELSDNIVRTRYYIVKRNQYDNGSFILIALDNKVETEDEDVISVYLQNRFVYSLDITTGELGPHPLYLFQADSLLSNRFYSPFLLWRDWNFVWVYGQIELLDDQPIVLSAIRNDTLSSMCSKQVLDFDDYELIDMLNIIYDPIVDNRGCFLPVVDWKYTGWSGTELYMDEGFGVEYGAIPESELEDYYFQLVFYDQWGNAYTSDLVPLDENEDVLHPELGAKFTSWADAGLENHPMEWNDDNLEAAMREITGIQNRDIMLSDVWELTQLRLSDCDITDISSLGELTNIQNLRLYYNNITDVSALSHLVNLTELVLFGNDIRDISALEALENLVTLDLNYTLVSDISPLKNLTNLEELKVSPDTWSDKFTGEYITDISPLAGLTKLKSLLLYENMIEDISPLTTLTNLSSLLLDGNQIEDISSLSNLTNLTFLTLGNNKIRDVEPLSALTSLTYLALEGNEISAISSLRDLIDLTDLDLSDNAIVDITALGSLTELTSLDLSYNEICNVEPLGNLVSLEKLVLYHNKIIDINPLGSLTSLDYLQLSDNEISDVSSLGSLTSLTALSLNDNYVSDISSFETLENLHNLSISCYWGGEIVDISSLGTLTNLTDLNLQGHKINDISPLGSLTILSSLLLDSNQIEDISSLSNLTNLTFLTLGNNKIRDVEPLSALTSLTYLALEGNEISAISSLRDLIDLTDLDLSDNAIVDITALGSLTELTSLKLSYNEIGNIEPLGQLKKLEYLYLDGNEISNVNALGGLTGLTWLRLTGNPVSFEALQELQVQLPDTSILSDVVSAD